LSKLDKIKGELNYPKVWLGVFIVAATALIGWLAEHIDNNFKNYLAIASVAALSVAVVLTHCKIIAKIEETEDM
jgi:small basic protein